MGMNSDTIKLLRSCNEGCKFASSSMEHVLPFVKNVSLKNSIEITNIKHMNYYEACSALLRESGKKASEPATFPMMIHHIKNDVKLGLSSSPKRVASIMVERCENGVRSVCKALKNCPKADRESVDIAKKIIKTEQEFLKEMIEYF